MSYSPKYKCSTSPLLVSTYENVEYYNINTKVVKTRVSNVHLPSSVLREMTEEVYSFSSGVLMSTSSVRPLLIVKMTCNAE